MENPGLSIGSSPTLTSVTDGSRSIVEDVSAVIQMLIESPPSLQQRAIERFFTPSAEFVHPFCRVWGYKGSRWAVIKIFQWYKIMSPRIEHQIHSIGTHRFIMSKVNRQH